MKNANCNSKLRISFLKTKKLAKGLIEVPLFVFLSALRDVVNTMVKDTAHFGGRYLFVRRKGLSH